MDQKTQDIIEAIEYYLEGEYKVYSLEVQGFPLFKTIYIGGKNRSLDSSKKYLVNSIFNHLPEEFSNVDESILRKTIKNFIDKLRKN